jgi:hypothetical protein
MDCGRIQMRKLLRQGIKTYYIIYTLNPFLSRGGLLSSRLGYCEARMYRLASLRMISLALSRIMCASVCWVRPARSREIAPPSLGDVLVAYTAYPCLRSVRHGFAHPLGRDAGSRTVLVSFSLRAWWTIQMKKHLSRPRRSNLYAPAIPDQRGLDQVP